MLFVHGYPEFWFSWRHQLKYFAKNYWVVAFDLRGYGDSEKPEGVSQYEIEKLVDDIVGLVNALGKNRCILVAHDWGGAIAWYTTAMSSSSSVVEKLIILNSPHPGAYMDKLRSSLKQFLKSWYIFFFLLPYLPEFFATVNDIGIFEILLKNSNGTQIPVDIKEAYKYTYSNFDDWTTPINYYRAIMSPRRIYNQDGLKLPKISQPTLVVWGEQDMALESDFPERSVAFCTGITEIHRIKDGNHFIQNDRPDEVNAAIQKFLS